MGVGGREGSQTKHPVMYDPCIFDVTSEKYRDHHFLDEHSIQAPSNWHAPSALLSCTPFPCERYHYAMLPEHFKTKSLTTDIG